MVDFAQPEDALYFYRTVVEMSEELTILVDESWNITFATEKAEAVTGYTAEEIVGLNAIELIYPPDLDIAAAGVAAAESVAVRPSVFGQPAHLRIVKKDGTPTVVAVGFSNLRSDPRIGAVALRVKTANARWHVDAFLEALMGGADPAVTFDRLASAVTEDIPYSKMAVAFDWDGQRYRQVLGYDLPEPLSSLLETTHDVSPLAGANDPTKVEAFGLDDLPPTWAAAARVAGAVSCWIKPVDTEAQDARRARLLLWRWSGDPPEVNHELDLQRYANFARLALDRWERDHQLRHAAHHDELTGLLNRAGFYGRLEAMADDARLFPVCLLFIDLDGFKEVNDHYGHPAGDEVLQVLARRIESTVRPTDVVARLGGDEFAVLAFGVDDAAAAEAVANRLLARFTEPMSLGEIQVEVGGSIGVSITRGGEPLDAVVQRADLAMYGAKSRGRNRFELDPHSLCDDGPTAAAPIRPKRNVRR